MTLEQRIEAAAMALALSEMSRSEQGAYVFSDSQPQAIAQPKRGIAMKTLSAAFPEFFAGTHKIVPMQPTDGQLDRGWTEVKLSEGEAVSNSTIRECYRAMIEAAP